MALTAWFLVLFSWSAFAIPQFLHGLVSSGSHIKSSANANYFTQYLDHFDGENIQTWKQRWWVNATFFNQSTTGPVFLCVGGETYLDDTVVITGDYHCADMITYAQQYGALILALEHRYYGLSNPTPDLTTPNMRYLSSEQALSDLAEFCGFIRRTYNLTSTNRWVSFGGSYPGMLAGWSRLKFPHLIWAAVASSAPVKAIANYQGYNNVVASSMAATDVGGSSACASSIQQAFQVLGTNLGTSNGRRTLEAQFNVCKSGSLDDFHNQQMFMISLSELFPAQSNDPACTTPYCNISGCCQMMLNSSVGDSLSRLAALQIALSGGACMNVDWGVIVAGLKDTRLASGQGRIWFYQTCTEFGFYQTCDPGTQCIFTTSPWLDTLQMYYELCYIGYEIEAKHIEARINYTNLVYGADQTAGSRILFVNGEIDPWHAASVLSDLSPDEPALWVEGASHHAWTHPAAPTDQQSVVEVRQLISQQVGAWLAIPN